MRVLFDHNVPSRLAVHLQGHSVSTAVERGWDQLTNGDLLGAAEAAGFDVLVTADKNMRYQQDLSRRKIALVVLGNSPWPLVKQHVGTIRAALDEARSGSYVEVAIPLPPKRPFPASAE